MWRLSLSQAMESDLARAEARIQEFEKRVAHLSQQLADREIQQRDFERALEDLRREEVEVQDSLDQSAAAIHAMEEVLRRLESEEQVTQRELEQAMQATVESRRQLQQASQEVETSRQQFDEVTLQAEQQEMTADLQQQELDRVRQRVQALEQETAAQQANMQRLVAAVAAEQQEIDRLTEEMRREEERVQELERLAQQDESRGNDHCAQVYRRHKEQHQQRANAARRQLGANNRRNQARLHEARRRLEHHQQLMRGEQITLDQTGRSKQQCDERLRELRQDAAGRHQELQVSINMPRSHEGDGSV
jgi:chromosome segregation ATPase